MNPGPHPHRSRLTGTLLALGLLMSALAAGWHLLALRHRSGTAHPPYSSERADPLGCRVLHDALAEVEPLRVRRWMESAQRLPQPRQTLLWVLGCAPADTASLPETTVRGLEEFANAGGRVVIALAPLPRETWASQRAERRVGSAPAGGGFPEEHTASMRERWGFQVTFRPLPNDAEGLVQPAIAQRADAAADLRLSDDLACHTAVRFTDLAPAWRSVYAVEDLPVVALRSWGAGEICLIADAYPFSNEGLASLPGRDMLSWLIGRRTQIAFNETHLGTLRAGGLASLARHYRLEGFLLGAIVVLVLLVMRLQSPLVPRTVDASHDSGVVTGLGAEAGLTSLIQRMVPAAEWPRLAFEEWQQSVGQHDPGWTPILPHLAETVRRGAGASGHDRDPVATLAALSRIAQPPERTEARRPPRRHPLDLPRP